ncbi:conserved hypothetical protein [Shewanella sediminis HAW-EB3]|uniref:Cytochrome c-type protein NrfB-like domain-containing protein n=1 Tax=Shewanella sediminis (strain HAW-EB3) TaxID=425104 RepID=A8FQK8_SHESH|nr:cytochrome c3 family protein [Shewanella sediminis]ABV35131.1 conserved hypothetical protein [Shewanella sediminis HAW-EB3]
MSSFKKVFTLSILTLTTFISTPLSISYANTLELTINTNKQCIMCHKKNGKMFGIHSSNSLELRCQNCHREKEGHPRKKSSLIKFSDHSLNTAEEQTAVCTTCHNSDDLTEVDWTHAVHSNKVNCAKCHQLHTETDPVIAISTGERRQLCVNCHESR